MPYIDPRVREEFEGALNPLLLFVEERGLTTGELNYLVTRLILASLYGDGPRFGYADLSATVAAVRDAADEFKRRLMGPYEDAMISRNGDLYAQVLSKVPPVRAAEEKKP
jgi:hypothetical protein